MSRKSRRSETTSRVPVRDTRRIANSGLLYRTQPELPLGLPVLAEIEDRRTFHPRGAARNARSFRVSHHSLVPRSPSPYQRPTRSQLVAQGIAFRAPRDVLVCVRRKRRKEVIHAIGKAGSGVKRAQPRRSYYSDVVCK